MIFDFETDGINHIITKQKAISLSWVLTNKNHEILKTYDYYFDDVKEINCNIHDDFILQNLETNCNCSKEILEKFVKHLNIIKENDGKIIAHNIKFDLKILENECKLNDISFLIDNFSKQYFCSMNESLVLCDIKSKKYKQNIKKPKLIELYNKLYPNEKNNLKLHISINDVKILNKCCKKLFPIIDLKKNILSLKI